MAAIDQVVVPIDASDESLRALGPAKVIADAAGTGMIAATVVAKSTAAADESRPFLVTSSSSEPARSVSASIADDFESYVIYDGNRTGSIVDFADGVDASILAVGTHRRVGLSRVVFGSVAIQSVTEAHCPVLTVPEMY